MPYKDKSKNDECKKRYRESHREYYRKIGREYYIQNRKLLIKRTINWQENNKDRFRLIWLKCMLKKRYNLSLDEFDILFKNQKGNSHTRLGICGICEKYKLLCIDHNHKNGKIRGLLCKRCNALVALFENNPYVLINMQQWLKGVEKYE